MGINKREEYELFNLKNNFGIKTNTNKLGMNKFWLEFRKPLREAQFQNCLSMAVMGVQQHQDFLNCRLLHLWRKFNNIISKAKVQCRDFFLGHSFSNIGYKCMLIKKDAYLYHHHCHPIITSIHTVTKHLMLQSHMNISFIRLLTGYISKHTAFDFA